MDKMIGGIASHPARVNFLKRTIDSIYDQFDVIHVYLNNYESIPEFLLRDKINPILSSEADGNLKALGKFYMAGNERGYYFSMDDDLIYPKDYQKRLTTLIDDNFKSIVAGVHATIYQRHPVQSYYRDKGRRILYCYNQNTRSQSVHMLGTGTMAYHTDVMDFDWSLFKDHKNMLDPQMCRLLQGKEIPVRAISRKKGWIQEMKGSQDHAIWKSVSADDSEQTNIMNSIKRLNHFEPNAINYKNLGDASIETGLVQWMVRNIDAGSKVVELGSGSGSKEIVKGFELLSIEHNEKYLKSNDNTVHAPLMDGWYDTDKIPDIKKGVKAYLIDGPPARQSDRRKLLDHINLFNKKAIFIMDDVNRSDEMEMAKEIEKVLGRKMTIHKGVKKNFATI